MSLRTGFSYRQLYAEMHTISPRTTLASPEAGLRNLRRAGGEAFGEPQHVFSSQRVAGHSLSAQQIFSRRDKWQQ